MRDGAASLIGTIRIDHDDDDVGSSASNHSIDPTKLFATPNGTSYVIQVFKFAITVIMAILFVKVAAKSNLTVISRFADAITDGIAKSSETSVELLFQVTQGLVEPYIRDISSNASAVSRPFI